MIIVKKLLNLFLCFHKLTVLTERNIIYYNRPKKKKILIFKIYYIL